MQLPSVPLQYLKLFPLIAGSSWLITLLSLLIVWLAEGRPKYPLQSNPYVAYISDIGAFSLKPLFLIGGILTALSFIGTICSVHYARFSPKMYGLDDAPFTKTTSATAVLAGIVSGISLILLSVLDTYRYSQQHRILLMVCFGGLGVAAICTSFVYGDQTRKASPYTRLRMYCVTNTAIVACELGLGIAFIVLLWNEWWYTAGVLEWVITILGAFWLGSFVGYVAVPEDGIDLRERIREPLLGDERYLASG